MFERPILIITISYIIGILLGLYLEINMPLFIMAIVIVIIFLILFALAKYKKSTVINKCKEKRKLLCMGIVIIIISILLVQHKEHKFKTLYSGINTEIKYIGTVVALEAESEYYSNYIIEVREIAGATKEINADSTTKNFKNTKLRLQVKKNKIETAVNVEYGDVVTGVGNIEMPATRRNYKGYDYSQYLKTKNVYAICKSNASDVCVIKKNSIFFLNTWIYKLRNTLKGNIYSVLPKDMADVAIAFLLGDSNNIEESQMKVFSNASLLHILAISGMHVTYIICGCSLVLKKFDKRKSKYVFIIFLIFFAMLTGGSPSVVRAVIMSIIMISSKILYRKSDTINNIGISCLVLLIANPYNIFNLGFQLSFLGTLGIVLFNRRINNILERIIVPISIKAMKKLYGVRKYEDGKDDNKGVCKKLFNKVISTIALSISANLLIFPILIYKFNTISFTFLISNMLIIPILGCMMLSGYITLIISLISIKLAQILAFALCISIRIFEGIAEVCSNISVLRCIAITPSLITVLLYYVTIFYAFYFYKKNHKKNLVKTLLVAIILVIIVNFLQLYNCGLKLYFIDVGQGDSSLIITSSNKKILIDGGGSESNTYDVGEKVLLPYLLNRKIITIDYMIFSHFDSDHCKGLFTVMENIKVKNAIISKQGEASENYSYFLKLAKSTNTNIIYVKAR
ncbi:MAG: ComEC/Rec2 family competence protein [Clostridia bacterium]|nr:ComEC/Rec2 family competence protein [Clostridia bacterium]